MGSAFGCGPAPVARSWPAVVPSTAPGSRAERRSSEHRSDVSRVLHEGRPSHGSRVVAFVAPGSGKVAFVAGRRVGGAVVRNRARRVLRAAWQQLCFRAGGDIDVVLVARVAIRGAKTQDLVTELDELLTHARVLRP